MNPYPNPSSLPLLKTTVGGLEKEKNSVQFSGQETDVIRDNKFFPTLETGMRYSSSLLLIYYLCRSLTLQASLAGETYIFL